MDLYKEECYGETPPSWKDIPFDAWTASSVGNMDYLCYISKYPELQNSFAEPKKEILRQICTFS